MALWHLYQLSLWSHTTPRTYSGVWSWNSEFLSSVRSLSCNFKIPKSYHSICFRTMYFYLDKHTTPDFLTYNIYIEQWNRQLCYYLWERSYWTSQGSMSDFFSFQKQPPFLFQVFWISFHSFKSIPWKWEKRNKAKAEAGSSGSGQMERAWHIKHEGCMNHGKPVGLIKGRGRQTHDNVRWEDDAKQVIRQEGKTTVRRDLGRQTQRARWASKSCWSRSFQSPGRQEHNPYVCRVAQRRWRVCEELKKIIGRAENATSSQLGTKKNKLLSMVVHLAKVRNHTFWWGN